MMFYEALALTIFCSTVVLYLALKVKPSPAETPADKFYRQIAEHCAANAAHFEAISYRYREPPAKPYREGGIVHSHPRKVFGRAERPSLGEVGSEGCSCPGAVGVTASAAQVSANAAIVAAQ